MGLDPLPLKVHPMQGGIAGRHAHPRRLDDQGFLRAKADFAALVEQGNWLRDGGMTSPAIVKRHAREASSIASSVISGIALVGITLASVL